jgi:hypothetical protein
MSQSKTLSPRGVWGPSPVRCAVWLLSLSALLSVASVLEYLIVAEGSPSGGYAINATTGIGLPLVLALLVRRGYRWARAAVWIWVAAGLLAVGIVVAGRPWDVLQVLIVISGLGVPVAVSVLLALPSSNQYFRRT